jgi:hypothetical protein
MNDNGMPIGTVLDETAAEIVCKQFNAERLTFYLRLSEADLSEYMPVISASINMGMFYANCYPKMRNQGYSVNCTSQDGKEFWSLFRPGNSDNIVAEWTNSDLTREQICCSFYAWLDARAKL